MATAQAAKAYGMVVSALSAFACNGCEPQNGLVLGYGNTSVDQWVATASNDDSYGVHEFGREKSHMIGVNHVANDNRLNLFCEELVCFR